MLVSSSWTFLPAGQRKQLKSRLGYQHSPYCCCLWKSFKFFLNKSAWNDRLAQGLTNINVTFLKINRTNFWILVFCIFFNLPDSYMFISKQQQPLDCFWSFHSTETVWVPAHSPNFHSMALTFVMISSLAKICTPFEGRKMLQNQSSFLLLLYCVVKQLMI